VTVEFFCTFTHTQCAYMHDLLRQIQQRHPDRLRVIYRHVVLPYRDNQAISEAGVEMWRQGLFFEFADAVYQKPGQFALKDLEPTVRQIGGDVDALRAALADHRGKAILERDALWRDQLGVNFPAVLWNGTQIQQAGVQRIDDYEAQFEVAQAAAQKRIADGVPAARLYAVLLREAMRGRISARHDNPRQQIDLGAPRVAVRTEGAPARGPAGAPVTIVVFSDFECPFCRREVDQIKRLEQIYAGRVRIVYKHFPLAFHANARGAAEASVCAHMQGKFWAYHDLVFKNYGRARKPDLLRYAAEANLDVAKLAADLDGGRCAAAVDSDIAEGKALGIEITPTLFVNGLKLVGIRTLAELNVVVDDELAPGWLEGVTEDTP
jgi:protein-disulfide isomerase